MKTSKSDFSSVDSDNEGDEEFSKNGSEKLRILNFKIKYFLQFNQYWIKINIIFRVHK